MDVAEVLTISDAVRVRMRKSMRVYAYITKTRLFKYIENFTTKNWKFSDKKLW